MSNYWDAFISRYREYLPDLTLRQTLEALCHFVESSGKEGAQLFIIKTLAKNGEKEWIGEKELGLGYSCGYVHLNLFL